MENREKTGKDRIEELRAAYREAVRKTEIVRQRYGMQPAPDEQDGESGRKAVEDAISPDAVAGAERRRDDAAFALAQAEIAEKTGLEEAFTILNDLANRGNTKAIMQFASMFEKGNIYTRDYQRALECCEWADELGDRTAAFQIAKYYRLGLGVRKNLRKAADYFEKASRLGDRRADYQLADIYFELGHPEKGAKQLRKCMDGGMKEAAYDYAMCLLYGDGVRRDVKKAVQLLEERRRSGDREAAEKLAYMYSVGFKVKRDAEKAAAYRKETAG